MFNGQVVNVGECGPMDIAAGKATTEVEKEFVHQLLATLEGAN